MIGHGWASASVEILVFPKASIVIAVKLAAELE